MNQVTVLLLLSLLVFVGAVDSVNSSNVMKIAKENWRHPKNLLKYNTDQAQKNSTDENYLAYDLGIVVESIHKLNASECRRDAMTVMEAITRRERWAIQMFDSSSKFPVGLLYGNFYQLGNFDECINLKQPKTENGQPIQGQYCLADVELFNKQSNGRVVRSSNIKKKSRNTFDSVMYWSICVPSSCTTEEVKMVIEELFTLATDQKHVTVRLARDKCQVKSEEKFTVQEILYGTCIAFFVLFTLSITIFHYFILQRKTDTDLVNRNSIKDALLCFSVIATVGKFLSTKSSSLHLDCICGIKFISMLFIVMGHTMLFMVGRPVQNTEFYDREIQNPMNAIFINSPILVDTFLLVSGLLMSYLLLLELDKRKGKINVLIIYIARYIRLTPSYLVVIGFYATFLYRIGDGPLWSSRIKAEQKRCQNSWWTNVLYVNNYVNNQEMCMFQSWYLAVDYHLFIIAPLFIFFIWKRPKIGKTLLGLGVVISVLIPFVITLKDKLDPTFMIFAPEVYDVSENFYFITAYTKTHMRAGSYLLGLLFGYVLYKLQTKGTKIARCVVTCGWLVAASCGIISMFSVTVFYYPEHESSGFESASYASLHRVAWCASIGWIIVACVTKNARLVNAFLSWKPFLPLSRLTYSAYLVNGFVEVYSLGTVRRGVYMSKFEIATVSLAHAIMTFFFAFVLCIFFESPIHGLEKILLRSAARRRSVDDGNGTTQ